MDVEARLGPGGSLDQAKAAAAVLAALTTPAAQPGTELAVDGCGLTPREREVLALVASVVVGMLLPGEDTAVLGPVSAIYPRKLRYFAS